MRLLAFLIFSAFTTCAPAQNNPNAIDSPHNSLVDAEAYNKIMSSIDLSSACPKHSCDRLPRLLAGYTPDYPPNLWAAGVTGSAIILFTINEQGLATDLSVESSTAPEFSAAAIQALKEWRFSPAMLNRKAIPMKSRQPFPFELR
jgi:TonB family protein